MNHDVRVLTLSVLALASVAHASDPVPGSTLVARTSIAAPMHVFLNLETGDRVILPGVARQGNEIVYANDGDNCGGLPWLPLIQNGIYDPANGFDGEVTSYGDIPAGTEFNCYTWLYVVQGIPDSGSGALGFDGLATFYNNDNSSSASGPDVDVDVAAGFLVTDIRGDVSSGPGSAWLLTVDVSAGGTQSFLIGDQDEDGDGLADIGWGYSFGGPAIINATDFGPGTAVPGNADGRFPGSGAALPASQGVEDQFIVFDSTFFTAGEPRGGQDVNGEYTNIIGAFNFGGWTGDCVNDPAHASLWIQLLNDAAPECPPCTGNFDNSPDTVPNSSDFLAYLNDYSAQSPCADLAPAGGNSVWDSSDFLAFLNAYSAGC